MYFQSLWLLVAIGGAAAATLPNRKTSNIVKGAAFDRIAIIYFENQNYEKAQGDANFRRFADTGITLTNYYAATHPSQPNYMASVAGDYFGMSDDSTQSVTPSNVFTVIDLLESKGISWAFYEEDMPYTGYLEPKYDNPDNGQNMYVRKHNPAILHQSIIESPQRLSQVKNVSLKDISRSEFHKDLAANNLPQWMFITPNMTSDGHDSSITTAGEWARAFLDPLLQDGRFMANTTVLLTWDESESYTARNQILGILLGDAIPPHLIGTEDNSFYTHYSEISTVEANWDLPTLGRWDVGANVYSWVANKTGDQIRSWSSQLEFNTHYWNLGYGGYFSSTSLNKGLPKPNLDLDHSFCGRRILQLIKDTWAHSNASTYYKDTIEVPDGLNPPPGYGILI